MKNKLFSILEDLPIIALLLVQGSHTYDIYLKTAPGATPFLSFLYAAGIESAIYRFTRRGWIKTSIGYAALTLLANLLFFFDLNSDATRVLIAILLTVTLASYTHLLVEKIKSGIKDNNTLNNTSVNASVKATISEEKETLAEHEKKELKKALNTLIKPLVYECSECGEKFDTPQALGGHKTTHRKTLKNTET